MRAYWIMQAFWGAGAGDAIAHRAWVATVLFVVLFAATLRVSWRTAA